MRKTAVLAMLLAAFPLFAEKMPLSRYESLIERYPFGQPPPDFNPDRMASEVSKNSSGPVAEAAMTEEQAVIAKNVSFSVLNVDSSGTVMVGFTDNSDPKLPRHYYMGVGESRDGWIVKEADPAAKTMTVEKDGVEVALDLGGNSGGKDAKTPGANGRTPARAPGGGRSPLLADAPGRPGFDSFRSRRAKREREAAEAEERRRAADEESKKKAEAEAIERENDRIAREEERAEQRRQLEAIRAELRKARESREEKNEETPVEEN
jgi:flagellar biosynthesis GTPase FlhF